MTTSNLRQYKQKLSSVARLWDDQQYDKALHEVESLIQAWPGNAHLHILWASLVQLVESPRHQLDEAKLALQQAMDLDKDSPAAAIEMGHFLDNVEDNPRAASKHFADGVDAARKLLIDGLIGRAKALRQLDKREEFLRCLMELLHLTRFESGPKKSSHEDFGTDFLFEYVVRLKGPHAEQIQELLGELATSRTA
jgi:tetratricopeptide (TPR) repeat protein